MKLIIGLGNPGEKYINTRHNAGYMVVDKLKNLRTKKPKNVIITKTNTFMNDSGVAVKYAVNKHKVKTINLYIVHDDLDLPLGTWKLQFAKGPKDNGGINSIEQVLGTKNFWRIRIGIDNRQSLPLRGRNPENRISGEEYVLEDFTSDEKVVLDKVINDICKKLATS